MSDAIIKNVRLSFPDIFHAVEFKPGDGKPRWNATFLIEKGSETDKQIFAALRGAAFEVYGEKAEKFLESIKGNANKMCYLDGDLKDYDGYEGHMYLSSHRAQRMRNGSLNQPPIIIDRDKTPLGEGSGKPYAGCYVNAKVSFYAQKGENAGLRCSFSVIQFFKDGDAFSAGKPSVDGFDELEPESADDFV